MGQTTEYHHEKRQNGLKTRNGVLDGPRLCTATRKRVKATGSRRARYQLRIKKLYLKPENICERIYGQKSRAQNMKEIHFPFISAPQWQSFTLSETLERLRWSKLDFPLDKYEDWSSKPRSSQPDDPLLCCSTDQIPPWNLPPRAPPERNIAGYLKHLSDIWSRQFKIQIPSYWPVFSGVEWDQSHLFKVGPTDSSDYVARCRDSLPRLSTKPESDPRLPHECVIQSHLRSIQQPRVRMQWQLMQSMVPAWFHWRYQTEARSRRRQTRRYAAFLDYNQTSFNQDIWPQTAMSAFLHPLRNRTSDRATRLDSLCEAPSVARMGRLIMDVVSTDDFPSQSRKRLHWPTCLSLGNREPIVDFTCQGTTPGFGTHETFHPLLFAAQYMGRHRREAIETLNLAFQPMMTLFILYYLDTRMNRDEPMPHWMVLFGVLFDDEGIYIQAYYPYFKPATLGLPGEAGDWGWGAHSVNLYSRHSSTMTDCVWQRAYPLEVLYRIQGHCTHVLEHLRHWDGYDRVFQRLSI